VTNREIHAASAVTGWRHARAVALLPFMNAVVIPALILVFMPAPPPQWSLASLSVRGLGLALLCAGAALVAHSIRLFVRMGQGTLAPWDPARALLRAGAYRYCRNPLKAGLFVVLAGEALLLQSTALLGWLGIFAAANVLYIRVSEEPGLRARFGQPYLDYCARVPRWLPKRDPRAHTLEEKA
jgi:protein-S-isoprenylcysteine O-methyltransferase Ste14